MTDSQAFFPRPCPSANVGWGEGTGHDVSMPDPHPLAASWLAVGMAGAGVLRPETERARTRSKD